MMDTETLDISTGKALQILTQNLKDDPELAWSYHCNFAIPIMDRCNVSPALANYAASNIMQTLFDIDTKSKEFEMYNRDTYKTFKNDIVIEYVKKLEEIFVSCYDVEDFDLNSVETETYYANDLLNLSKLSVSKSVLIPSNDYVVFSSFYIKEEALRLGYVETSEDCQKLGFVGVLNGCMFLTDHYFDKQNLSHIQFNCRI